MQRQREGIAKAKGEGNFKGRKRKPDLMPEKEAARKDQPGWVSAARRSGRGDLQTTS